MTLLRTVAVLLALSSAACIPQAHADEATVAEQYLLSAANQERAALGLPQLRRDAQLAQAAQQHARTMAAHANISHQFPGEPELSSRGASAGVRFSVISENVAQAPSPVKIHDMWMRSPHHRDNLLDPAIDSAGISVIARNGELYAVEDFARTVQTLTFNQQEAAIANLIASSSPLALDPTASTLAAARQTCAMTTGFAGPRKPWFVMRFTSDSVNVLPDELKARLTSGRFRQAAVGACSRTGDDVFTSYTIAVLLYP